MHKKKIRFSPEDDLHLLREVHGQNPYEDTKRWNVIQIHMLQITGKNISVRTLRERVQNLIRKYMEKQKTQEYQPESEEEVNEVDDLVQQISDIIDSLKKENVSVSNGYNVAEDVSMSQLDAGSSNAVFLPEYIPEEFVQEVIAIDEADSEDNLIETKKETPQKYNENPISMNSGPQKKRPWPQRNISGPSRKRQIVGVNYNTLEYSRNKYDKSYDLRTRELALQERKQALEERKFGLEEMERRRRLDMEEKKFEVQMKLFENQQKLLEIILSKMSATSN